MIHIPASAEFFQDICFYQVPAWSTQLS